MLDKVEMADNVRVALFTGSLVGGPFGNYRREGFIDGDIGLGRLATEEGGTAGEVVVEGLQDGGLVVAGLETLRRGKPLLDFRLLGGSVGLVGEGHFGDAAEGGWKESPGDGTHDASGKQLGNVEKKSPVCGRLRFGDVYLETGVGMYLLCLNFEAMIFSELDGKVVPGNVCLVMRQTVQQRHFTRPAACPVTAHGYRVAFLCVMIY